MFGGLRLGTRDSEETRFCSQAGGRPSVLPPVSFIMLSFGFIFYTNPARVDGFGGGAKFRLAEGKHQGSAPAFRARSINISAIFVVVCLTFNALRWLLLK